MPTGHEVAGKSREDKKCELSSCLHCLLSCLCSCHLFDFLAGGTTNSLISFNLDGAKALLTASPGSKSLARASETPPSVLVKILDDGAVQAAITVTQGVVVPDVHSIAIGPAGSVYVLFESSFAYNNENLARLIQVRPDNSFAVVCML